MQRFFISRKNCFRSVDKLIVTSEKFFTEHYKNFFKGTFFVLENKPLKSLLPERVPKNKNSKGIIGIVGLLLQLDVYERLLKLLKMIVDTKFIFMGWANTQKKYVLCSTNRK